MGCENAVRRSSSLLPVSKSASISQIASLAQHMISTSLCHLSLTLPLHFSIFLQRSDLSTHLRSENGQNFSVIHRLYAVVVYNLGTMNVPKDFYEREGRVPCSDVRSGIFM